MSTGTTYEVAMQLASPMWGRVEDHAAAATKIDDPDLQRVIDLATRS